MLFAGLLSLVSVQVPVCLVSIVDDDHQWFKSNQGLACSATDRKSSFCAWTLLPQHPELLIVEDALEDARYSLTLSCCQRSSPGTLQEA